MTRRSSARESKRQRATIKTFDQTWRRWTNPYKPIEQFSEDQIESIHMGSLKVLSETGIKVLDQESRELYARAGMKIRDNEIVLFDPDQLMELSGFFG